MSTPSVTTPTHKACQQYLQERVKTLIREGDYPNLKWAKPKSNGWRTKPLIFPRIFVRGPVIYERGTTLRRGSQEVIYAIHTTFNSHDFHDGIQEKTPPNMEGATALRTLPSEDLLELMRIRKTNILDCIGVYNLQMVRELKQGDFDGFALAMTEGLQCLAQELYRGY